jgi:flavin-dependent dehydrogenase
MSGPEEHESRESATAGVLVVGGGVAGASAAIAVARRGASVVLVERAAVPSSRVGEVLPPGVRRELAQLGIWERVCRETDPLPSAGISLWWGTSTRQDWDYIRSPFGTGWHVDRRKLEATLLDAAREAGATVQMGIRIRRVVRAPSGCWVVEGVDADGSAPIWRTRLLIHAAGRSTIFRHITGDRVRFDRMVGLARYYTRRPGADADSNPSAGEPRLWVETTRDGWWYSAPLSGDRLIAVFLTDADLISAAPEVWFATRLHDAPQTAARLAGCDWASPVRVSPAETSRLARFTGAGFVAVGDAAYTTDPARGQGIIKALKSGAEAADAIIAELGGNSRAVTEYDARLEAEFREYSHGLPEPYRRESRWSDAPFWSRRHVQRRLLPGAHDITAGLGAQARSG